MPGLDDVRRLALALPDTGEKVSWGAVMWTVQGKGFVWERPLRTSDVAALERLGREIPEGEILGVRVAGETEKAALLASDPDVFFSIPHLDGYPAVLVRLETVAADELAELVTDAWLDRAPKRLAQAWLAEHP
ncbi:MmcQ/YjbR family DNA-binding protein [Nocardioides ferulae]|uniref:MmcQ/YjbR family DNA-binding protein n=1 Tax=Nocardioides ferulae TaxID=2340821 RepID=UPI000EAE57F5|nr:MmcQ/YjbR family DNA-binding protein [Nocardioides ferulae]